MIPLFKVHTPDNIGEELQKVFDSGFISEGEQSDKFEQEFSNYIGNKDTCLVNSCTSALTLSYDLSGVGPGKEVISTPMTCMATNEPIQTMGAKIVWADIDPATGNIDPESVKKKINKNTAAIVGVHWSGIPFEIDAIKEIAKENNVRVIEDAAHALGSKYKGKLIGNHSDYVCFSFQAIKHLTTGDGGAIVTNADDAALIRKLRWFGLDRKYNGSKWEQDIERSGYKFHMNNINATIGLCQMPYLNMIVNSHIENGKFYDDNIKNKKITILKKESHVESASWIYSILVEDRESLKKYLYDHGIASDVVHVRNDKYTVFKDYFSGDLQGCDEFCSKLLNIPVGWWVSKENREYIVSVLNKWDNK